MTIKKPYYRNCRQFIDGSYANSGQARYIDDQRYAENPAHYVRAFFLIQKDLINLFDYIDPSDKNLDCHSFRIHELLVRTCIEIEANFKAILKENTFDKNDQLNMTGYRVLENTHLLSQYEIRVPYWRGDEKNSIRTPFLSFLGDKSPEWYKAYNTTKHDRHHKFENANFANLIDAVCGLVVVLSSQFYTKDFSPSATLLEIETGINDGFESAIGGYFRVKFPEFPHDMRYDFTYQEWIESVKSVNAFEKFDYNSACHENKIKNESKKNQSVTASRSIASDVEVIK